MPPLEPRRVPGTRMFQRRSPHQQMVIQLSSQREQPHGLPSLPYQSHHIARRGRNLGKQPDAENNGTGSDMLIVSLSSADSPIRITGIFFNCTGWAGAGGVYQHAIHFSRSATAFRIDHCKFNLGKQVLFFYGGRCNGVVDHCTSINPSEFVYYADIEPGDVKDGDHAWARPVVPGTTDCVCVEDCTILRDNNWHQDNDEDLYCWTGGRAVWRHNTTISTYSGGLYVSTLTEITATAIFTEVRSCMKFTRTPLMSKVPYRFCYLRGGRHLFWNNTFINHAGNAAAISLTWEGMWYDRYDDNIKNSYFWNNTLNGSSVNPGVANGSPIVLNQDYWTHAPQSGQTYYPYTPLQYPHPLVTGGGPTPTPTPTPIPTPTPTPLGLAFNSNAGNILRPVYSKGG